MYIIYQQLCEIHGLTHVNLATISKCILFVWVAMKGFVLFL